MLSRIIILFLLVTVLYGQDSTRSEAFKNNRFYKPSIFKAKYPSYSLLAGYLLVTEANRGDPFAQHELGIRYLIGQGFAADTVKSVYWINKAVDQNLPAARFNYGILLHNGIGVPWNPYEAYLNFRLAGQAGLPEAQFAYGILLTDNLTVNRNLNEAYQLISKSAKAGYEPAKEVLKQFEKMNFIPVTDPNSKENSTIVNDETAKIINPNWDLDFYDFDKTENINNDDSNIEELLNKKSTELKRLFGLNDFNENLGIKDTSGIGILKFASDNGSPEALLIIGKGYETGKIFQENIISSASNYLRAYRLGSFKSGENLFRLMQNENFENLLKERIKAGDAEAMFVWAGIAALGYNNQLSEKQALDFLKTAVDKKHIPSMIELGLLYSSGTLVDKNRDKAIEYWELAKNMGSKEAEVRIAFITISENTGTHDVESQMQILRNSANQGSVLAQALLGLCYEKGLGVKESRAASVRFYRQAAQRGNQAAMNSLKRLYDEIRPMDDEFQIYEPD
ncbi:MAG: tetratricopeptide repeat protein [Melioribacteraceae bacterium]|nr:tetratricopeptide repeat protein [Melioribacteraceae bacterium]